MEMERVVLVAADDEPLAQEIGDSYPDEVKVLAVPRDQFEKITEFLADPSKGVRLERPKRKEAEDTP